MRTLIRVSILAATAMLAAGAAPGSSAAPVTDTGPTSGVGVLREGANGFAQALQPREFQFPRDHGPHPEFRHEWWYVTGNLDSTTGQRFGFELTFFRFALRPGKADRSPQPQSHWRTNQIYMAHFAVTDVEREQFRSSQRYSRQALGLAGAAAEPFRVWLEDWSLSGTQTEWRLHAAQEGYELTLDLTPLLAPVLNGEGGLSRKSAEPGAASYYYSIPRLAVRGKIVRDGQPFEVEGLAWFDREWGSGALGEQQAGWDWFALQLDDGGSLMAYILRNRDGSRDPHSAGTWVGPRGDVRILASDDVQVDVLDHWESPRGGRYPSRWRVRVPRLGIDVDVRPVLADQELDASTRYWEGAVDVRGTRDGTRVAGRGYVELVGYASSDR